jgi:hypothetical protein
LVGLPFAQRAGCGRYVPGIVGQAGTGFDPSKPWGLQLQAPLTPQYQKVLEASIADQANGGQAIGRRAPTACRSA